MKPAALSALALSALMVACQGASTTNNGQTGFTINGTVAQPRADEWIQLRELRGSQIVSVDSVRADAQGQFSFSGQVDEPGFYLINFYNQQGVMTLLENGDVLRVTADGTSMGDYQVEGSAHNEELRRVAELQRTIQAELEGLSERFQRAQTDAERDAIRQELVGLQDRSAQKIHDLIRSLDASLAALYAKDMLYAPLFPGMPAFSDPVDDVAFLDSLGQRLTARRPDSRYTREFMTQLQTFRQQAEANVSVGEVAPDIALPNPEGKTVSLSSLRGKYVLVDFWASWCGPCRKENPNVVRAYQRYKGQNFEILGVSLDQKRDRWLEAIAQDQLAWPHVSDLAGWQSSAAAAWNVQAIPASYLLDPEGRVIAKNLRGEALDQKLAELFAKG